MKRYQELWKKLRKEFGLKDIIDSFIAGFVYTLLLAIPIILALGQVISVYMYLLTLWVVLIIIVVALLNFLLHHWWKQTLLLKKPEAETDISKLFMINAIIICGLIIIIGLLFLFVFIPLLMV